MRRASSPTSRPTDSPCARSVEERARRGRAVARDERVDEAPDLALGGVRGGVLDDVAADARAGPELERELLELAQQPLLALADERRRAPARRRGRAATPSLAASRLQPARQVLGLQHVLGGDDRRRPSRRPSASAGQTLKRPSSRPKNAIVVSGAIASQRGQRGAP